MENNFNKIPNCNILLYMTFFFLQNVRVLFSDFMRYFQSNNIISRVQRDWSLAYCSKSMI